MSSLLPLSNNRGTGGIRFKTLVRPGALNAPLALTRSQLTGVQSTAIASDGSTVQTYGADIARFNGSARRLLIEGQRINVITNPRIIGGTGWTTASGGSVSASSEISPNGTQDAFLFNSTETGYGSVFQTVSVTAAQPYTLSVYAKAGNSNILALEFRGPTTAPNASFNLSNGTVASGSGTIVSAGNGWWRCSITVTSGDTSELAIISAGDSGAAGRTIHLWWPQCELGAFASTPILPPVGSPGTSTRGADIASVTLTPLGIGGNGASTLMGTAMMPRGASSFASQSVFSMDNGVASVGWWLVNEPARTNSFTNPRCNGAVVGTPGTLPTGWTIASALGLSTSVVSTGVEDGLEYFDLRFFGTPNATSTLQVNPASSSPASSTGQAWSMSLYTRLVGGSLTNVGNALLALSAGTAQQITTYTLSNSRLGSTRQAVTTIADSSATPLGRWRVNVTSGQAVDFTVRFAGSQLESGTYATSLLLPAAGVNATSTRAANTIAIVNAFDAAVVLGTMTPGTLFKWGVSISGTGSATGSLNGGATQTIAFGLSSGLTTLRLAQRLGSQMLFGEIGYFSTLPYVLPDAALTARVAALPN